MTRFQRMKRGAAAWRQALKAVRRQRSLKVFLVLPLFVHGGLLLLLLYFMMGTVAPWLLSHFVEGWWTGGAQFLAYLTALILWALLVVPVYALSNIVLAPVHSLAAEKVLKHKGLALPAPVGWSAWIDFFLRSMGVGLAKSIVLMVLAVPLFVGGFLPVLGLVFVYLSFVLLAFDCTDYSLEVLDKGFRERFSYLRRHLWEYMGFGLIFFVIGFIPLAMILLLPLGTVAGAHLVAELEGPLEEPNVIGRQL